MVSFFDAELDLIVGAEHGFQSSSAVQTDRQTGIKDIITPGQAVSPSNDNLAVPEKYLTVYYHLNEGRDFF